MTIRKAIIPVAGLGTRFLPFTKTIAKEMLPIIDKPAIQFIVEEAVSAGITDICFIISRNKTSILNHFDQSPELEAFLTDSNKENDLRLIQDLSSMIKITAIRQKQPLGLGHAIALGKDFAQNEPVAVLLGDDVMRGQVPAIGELISCHRQTGNSVVGIKEVNASEVHKYGIVSLDSFSNFRYPKVSDIVEKPSLSEAPSHYAALGRYILLPEIFPVLERLSPGKSGEIQLTDALSQLASQNSLYACEMSSMRYDLGDKLGFLMANIDFALAHPDLGSELSKWLSQKSLLNGQLTSR